MSPDVPHGTVAPPFDEPDSGGGPEHGDVGGAVAVVVAGHRDVAVGRPKCGDGAVPATNQKPVDGAEHGHVGVAVAVVVAGHGDVARRCHTARWAPPLTNQTPVEGRNTAMSVVAVAVVVAGHGDVAAVPKAT